MSKPRIGRLLLPYQVRWVLDTSRIAISEKARRVGMDWAEAFRVVRDRMAGGRRMDALYAAHREDAAREFCEYVKRFARDLYGAALELVVEDAVFDRHDLQVMRVAFPETGGRSPRLLAMTSAPGALRGFGGDVILSEFAHHEDAREMWRAATPSKNWGGTIRVISTHNGVGSVYNALLTGARRHADPERYGRPGPHDPVASVHRTTIFDAVSEGLVERINMVSGESFTRAGFLEECRRDAGNESAWKQEYCCEPADQESSYFPLSLLAGVVDREDPSPSHDLVGLIGSVRRRAAAIGLIGPVYAGVDVARTRDLFSVWVLGSAGPRLRTLGVLAMRGADFQAMELVIRTLCSDAAGVRPGRVCLDATGIGMQLAERMRSALGHVVRPVTITAPVKVRLMTRMRSAIERVAVSIPDDQVTLDDIASVRREVTASGGERYVADRSETDGHADRAVALALALEAADGPKGCCGVRTPAAWKGVLV